MKTFSALLVVTLLSAAIAQEKKTPVIPAGAEIAHKTTHRLEIELNNGRHGICSATAIGETKLLTATHCEVTAPQVAGNSVFKLDGVTILVARIERDGKDHSILFLKDHKFKDFAALSQAGLNQGEHIYIWGEPNGLEDIYREGVVVGKSDDVILLDLNGYFGDSGAGIFNSKGEVIGVISVIQDENESPTMPHLKFMGAYPLGFRGEQLAASKQECGD
jgi:hypothetical protein